MQAETRIHLAVIRWWALACHGYKLDERVVFHVPNGGKRGKIEAGILKGMGLRPGVPDLLLIVPRGTFVGLVLELKAPAGRLSIEQAQMLALFEKQGWAKMVCWSFGESVAAINNYLTRGDPLKSK